LRRPVVIVGCGGLGSWTSIMMAKGGWKEFVLVDPDVIEEKNLYTQAYFPEERPWGRGQRRSRAR